MRTPTWLPLTVMAVLGLAAWRRRRGWGPLFPGNCR